MKGCEIVANKRVTLLRYAKTENGWRRFPVVIGKTGKVRPDAVLVNGEERIYPEGYYCIRTYEGNKPKYTNVGTDPTEALLRQQREEKLLTARDSAKEADTEIVEPTERKALKDWGTEFLYQKSLEPHRSRDTMDGYRVILKEFLAGCGADYPDQIQAVDILEYCAGLDRQGLTARTRSNRFGSLGTFLRFCKLDMNDILTRETRRKLGKFPKCEPTAYSQGDLERLLSVCDDYYRLLFTFLTNTGFRMQEAMFLDWNDISFGDAVVSVRRKPGVFEVKDYEERSVPLIPSLAESLRKWKERRKNSRLVFGTRTDRPNNHWLEYLKAFATKAGLNCGACAGCKKDVPECQKYRIHKFRATYATRLLRNGVDVRTVQKLLGHSSLDSTLRYLQPAMGRAMQESVNAALLAASSGE